MKAIDLQTEHMNDPIGIDIIEPILTWKCQGGMKQTAYQLVCTVDDVTVADTGKVCSSETMVRYTGPSRSRSIVKWKVRLWDENDSEGDFSEVHSFEYALLGREFSAEWINPEIDDVKDENVFRPASYLFNHFHIRKGFEKVRIYATAHGIYTIRINSRTIEENVLCPGTSEYWYRLPYQTFNITDYVVEGENEIEVVLGDGWWRGSNGNTGNRNVFGKDVALLMQIEVDDQLVLKTDDTWRASQDGPIGFNDLQLGERADARKNCQNRHNVKIEKFGYDNLLCSNSVPIRRHESFTGKLINTPDGKRVIDFTQNIAGFIGFKLTAREGQTIHLTMGEYLDDKGNFSDRNFETIGRKNPLHQEVFYICKEGYNEYCSSLSIAGFQYALLETDIEVSGDEFTSYAVYSDIRQTAEFECDSQLVNRLFQNAVWSTKSNFVDIPTDCPQRERSGWAGDAGLYAYTGLRLMDTYPVYRKWLAEERVVQHKDGKVRNFAPRRSAKLSVLDVLYDGSCAWGDASVIVPYEMYRLYGDKTILEENYLFMKRWLSYCEKKARKYRLKNMFNPYRKLIIDTGIHYGEWLEAGVSMADGMKEILFKGIPEIATAYFAYSCRLMSEIAAVLNKDEDRKHYEQLSEKLIEAYKYIEIRDGKINSQRQSRFVRPLAMNLLNSAEKKAISRQLNTLMEANNYHLNTGFLTTPDLCRVLAENGYVHTAYKVLLQEDTPGWLFSVKQGATTIWESWEGYFGDTGVASLNHYSKGAVVSWMIDGICGIKVSDKKIVIKPHPDRLMKYAKARLDTPQGEVRSEWTYTDKTVTFRISVPSNGNCTFIYPDGKTVDLLPGNHELVYEEEQ